VANYLFLLLVLACPLMMVWMMRGGHGAHGAGGHDSSHHEEPQGSLEELRARRDELDRVIEERESSERAPAGVGTQASPNP